MTSTVQTDDEKKEKVIAALQMFSDIENAIKVATDEALDEFDLSTEKIYRQSLPELKESLEKIDIAIDNSSKLANKGEIIHIKVLPYILKTKNIIISRIQEIESAQEVEKIVKQVKEGSDDQIQEKIEKLLAMNEKWQEISIENEQARKKAQETLDAKAQELASRKEEREAYKERWAIRKSLLEKESVSTIVGAFLLVIIALSEIIFTFLHITPAQIIDNSFLVLLGYFFGQTVARATSQRKDEYKDN